MKNRYLTFGFLATAVLAGCSDDKSGNGDGSGETELRLFSGIETRAFTPRQSTTIASGEKVYVWADEGTSSYFNAWELTANGSNGFNEPTVKKYFPETGSTLDLYAIHGNFAPGITAETSDFPTSALVHEVKGNQTAVADYAISDLLYAVRNGVASTPDQVSLTFYHMLSKIEISVKPGNGLTDRDMTGVSVRLVNTKLKANFTPAKKSATELATREIRTAMVTVVDGSMGEISLPLKTTPKSARNFIDSEYGEAIIVPQTVNGQFIEVNLGGTTLYYEVQNQTFESAKRYRYNVIAHEDKLSVTEEVTDWGGEGGIVIEMIGEITDPTTTSVGDFAMSDGSFVGKDKTLTAEQQAACRGVVFWTGDPTENDPTLKADCETYTNGLIIALTDASSASVWQEKEGYKSVTDWLDANQSGVFSGITNTVNILGYNNSKAIEEFNAAPENATNQVLSLQVIKTWAEGNPAPENTSDWYLPSFRELELLCINENAEKPLNTENLSVIETQLKKVTGAIGIAPDDSVKSKYYHSSVETKEKQTMLLNVKNAYSGNGMKNQSGYVRAVCAF